jgi:L-alanine-DL-glutamate epimerase-like enolase superfamily enzyme
MSKSFIHELDYLKLMFIDESVLAENNEALASLALYTRAPIATGERFQPLGF